MDLTAPATSGTYYYGACVDTVTDESDTTNNCSSAVTVTVPEPDKPDLKIYAIQTVTDPNGTVKLLAGVRNQGGVDSTATTLRVYQSSDATITTSDTEVGTDDVGRLTAGGSRTHGADVNAPFVHRNVLLRCLRGRSEGRIRHDQQLLEIHTGRCIRVGTPYGLAPWKETAYLVPAPRDRPACGRFAADVEPLAWWATSTHPPAVAPRRWRHQPQARALPPRTNSPRSCPPRSLG